MRERTTRKLAQYSKRRVCPICGATFTRAHSDVRTCGRECGREFQRLRQAFLVAANIAANERFDDDPRFEPDGSLLEPQQTRSPGPEEIRAECARIRRRWPGGRQTDAKRKGDAASEDEERIGRCVGRCSGAVLATDGGIVRL